MCIQMKIHFRTRGKNLIFNKIGGGGCKNKNACFNLPVIIKFANPAIRLAFLRCKKEHTPAPLDSDKAAGTKKYTASEDLTGPTYKMFKAMVDSPLVDKVWTVDGRLRFTVPGDKSVKKVKSVFVSVADNIRG